MLKPKYGSRRDFLLNASQDEYDAQWARDELRREREQFRSQEEIEEAFEACEIDTYEAIMASINLSGWYPFSESE